jgi:polysaccharide biosynthesis/export protein
MKKQLATLCLLATALAVVTAQAARSASPTPVETARSSSDQARSDADNQRLSYASSSAEYPVTPADVYTLTFHRSNGDVQSQAVYVDSDYSVDLGIFGKINARGMPFADLRRQVESLVAESYARSFPSLIIESVGVFRVSLGGDIARPRFMNAWGMSRLSELVDAAGEQGASLRSVGLRSIDGDEKSFDLLRAMRDGEESQDPIMKPGDEITLYAASTMIKLSGEVRQAGSYELVPGEGLRDLVEKFGGGLSNLAETSRIRIDRITPGGPTTQYIALSKAYDPSINLEGCIAVSISSRMDRRPFVWFEGAVTATTSAADTAARTEAEAPAAKRSDVMASTASPGVGDGNRVAVQMNEGEMLSDALREIKDSLSPSADLASASLFRQGSIAPIPVNLQPLLAMANPPSDMRLEPYDRIFIPSLRSTVTVNGAVLTGGSFAYQPNSPASYYIGLAGGIDPERNGNGHYRIYDTNGKRRNEAAPLMPGDRIYVPINSFTYNLVRYTPVVSGIITLVIVVVPFVQTYIK